jgi:hypothetical protein
MISGGSCLHFVIVRYGTVSVYTHGKADNIRIYIVRYGTVSGNTRGKADNIKKSGGYITKL